MLEPTDSLSAGSNFEDRRSLAIRLGVLKFAFGLVFAVLAFSFWHFQVAQHGRYKEMAENNHQRTLSLRAPRGVLFDRHGQVLVENRFAFRISLVRERTRDLEASIDVLASAAGVDAARVREIVDRHRHDPPYRPVVVIEDASLAQVAAVAARRRELPAVVVEEVPTRHYPDEELGAHLFGYVGEVTQTQLDQPAFQGVSTGAIVGQSGLERAYNRLLMGTDGARRVVVNSIGREIETIGEVDPIEGTRLQLTIDYDLQRAAEEGFKANGFEGAAVVLDPRSGEVLALVSLPAYDPNAFATGIDRTTWGALTSDRLRPLQNRAIQGRYSPGSTFKIVVAVAGLEERVVNEHTHIHCSGGGVFYGRYFRCWKAGGHGSVDLRRALEQSCNVYFYTVGNMLGIDRLHEWATALGLGALSGIDLPNEVQGIMPSTEWKRQTFGERWYAGETISVAIGQGAVSVTPLSLATMIATVANGGTRFTPHLLKAVDAGEGWQPFRPPEPQAEVRFRESTLRAVRDGLWLAVNGAGTGGRARIEGYDVAGKTGTAQVISLQGRQAARNSDKDLRDHGWFVFFAPRDNPEIAGVVFAEHSESGGAAAPIAKHVMQTYFAKQAGQPLPEYPVPGAPTQQMVASVATGN